MSLSGERSETLVPAQFRNSRGAPTRGARLATGVTAMSREAKGAPASVVLGPLQEFLDAHRDEQVIVEWRVQE